MKRPYRWIVVAGALGGIFIVGFAAREILYAQQQNQRPQNDKWGPNSVPWPPLSAQHLPLPAMVPPGNAPLTHAIAPPPVGPILRTPQLRFEQRVPAPQEFVPLQPNQNYPPTYSVPLPSISSTTAYVPSAVQASSSIYAQPVFSTPPSNIYLSPASHSNALATSRLLQEYANCDDEAKREELLSQIKKHVTNEFEEKHAVTRRMLESLEKSAQKFREATEKREENKDKIIADRVASLVGRIDGTEWDYDMSGAAFPAIGVPTVFEFRTAVDPTLGTTVAPSLPPYFPPPQMVYSSIPNHGWSQPYASPGTPGSPAYAPSPNATPNSGPSALLPIIPSTPMPDESNVSPAKETHSEGTKPSETRAEPINPT